MNSWHRWVRRSHSTTPALVLAGVLAIAGCKGILDVQLPGNVSADALANPSLAPMLVNGAQGDFECAYTEYVYTTATYSNEMLNASGGSEVAGWSARFLHPEGGTGQCPTASSNRGAFVHYMPLQIARGQAELALKTIGAFTDAQVTGRALLLARAALYSAYAHTLLSEAYCKVALDDGPVQAPSKGLAAAETRFSDAIASATTAANTNVLNAALVGRARVRLDLGKKAEAAADAKLVPANFVFNATYDATPIRRNNDTYNNINVKLQLSVAPAYRNLTVGGVPDTRVVATDMKRQATDAVTPMWSQGKYTALTSPIALATWDEAQLIIAEAEGGQSAVNAINAIRTKYKLPAYAGGTDAEIRAQVIEERRRTLFLDGHRIGDQLRLNIPFASGIDQKGVRYNDATCIELPIREMTGRP